MLGGSHRKFSLLSVPPVSVLLPLLLYPPGSLLASPSGDANSEPASGLTRTAIPSTPLIPFTLPPPLSYYLSSKPTSRISSHPTTKKSITTTSNHAQTFISKSISNFVSKSDLNHTNKLAAGVIVTNPCRSIQSLSFRWRSLHHPALTRSPPPPLPSCPTRASQTPWPPAPMSAALAGPSLKKEEHHSLILYTQWPMCYREKTSKNRTVQLYYEANTPVFLHSININDISPCIIKTSHSNTITLNLVVLSEYNTILCHESKNPSLCRTYIFTLVSALVTLVVWYLLVASAQLWLLTLYLALLQPPLPVWRWHSHHWWATGNPGLPPQATIGSLSLPILDNG